MTTFTSEDRKAAYDPGMGCVIPNTAGDDLKVDLVAEAPYHPGYEDAVILKEKNSLAKEIDELFKVKNRHVSTSKKIIEFLKGGQKWDR